MNEYYSLTEVDSTDKAYLLYFLFPLVILTHPPVFLIFFSILISASFLFLCCWNICRCQHDQTWWSFRGGRHRAHTMAGGLSNW